ncbi:DTW domain-containing protein [uncultured Paraglaciecola sp.]|uniref:tRNA-uridine aminocarboxypropyltransferase n=1 Tax=uncultured Paraglaciecola sp. TaxID=1765024 RepID=UPI00259615E2|nr:DTW domain-containing protein [uncultured Paraglaciecola sp.]
MPHINSVDILRKQQQALSTKNFRARGYKVTRCDRCLIPVDNCICSQRPTVKSKAAFCLLMYKSEYYKPSNTGRVIADVITDNYAFKWDRVAPDPQFLALLDNPNYAPILVFPHQHATPERCIDAPQQALINQTQKVPLFIMLDGTWREAKKMFKSPSLSGIPVLGIEPEKASSYQLREAAHEHQLCTAEVAVEILKLADDKATAEALHDYFQIFRRAYIKGKPHLTFV